jgi:hypothetical protein
LHLFATNEVSIIESCLIILLIAALEESSILRKRRPPLKKETDSAIGFKSNTAYKIKVSMLFGANAETYSSENSKEEEESETKHIVLALMLEDTSNSKKNTTNFTNISILLFIIFYDRNLQQK